jgi:tetratricopeptide (TPR) repeat protein
VTPKELFKKLNTFIHYHYGKKLNHYYITDGINYFFELLEAESSKNACKKTIATVNICLARLYELVKQPVAFYYLRKALEAYHDWETYFWIARAYRSFAKPVESINHFCKALQAQPSLASRLTKDDINYIDKIITLKGFPESYLCRGLIYYYNREYRKALFYFDTVIQMKPDEAIAYLFVARLISKSKEIYAHYKTALELKPDLAAFLTLKEIKLLQRCYPDLVKKIRVILSAHEDLLAEFENKLASSQVSVFEGCLFRPVKVAPLPVHHEEKPSEILQADNIEPKLKGLTYGRGENS